VPSLSQYDNSEQNKCTEMVWVEWKDTQMDGQTHPFISIFTKSVVNNIASYSYASSIITVQCQKIRPFYLNKAITHVKCTKKV